MDTLLMVVTVVSLALAVGMAALAWHLLREHRIRSDARVEALQTMAADPAAVDRFMTLDDRDPNPADEAILEDPGDGRTRDTVPSNPGTPLGMPALIGLVVAAVALGLAGGVVATYTFIRPPRAGLSFGWVAQPRPLELLSLSQNSDARTFTVTGLVQNPQDGAVLQHVTAVVYLFDRDGNYFASGEALLDVKALNPGAESPFVVRVSSAGAVSRYRIGFRSENNGVIAHVDRRRGAMTGAYSPAAASPASSAAVHPASESQP